MRWVVIFTYVRTYWFDAVKRTIFFFNCWLCSMWKIKLNASVTENGQLINTCTAFRSAPNAVSLLISRQKCLHVWVFTTSNTLIDDVDFGNPSSICPSFWTKYFAYMCGTPWSVLQKNCWDGVDTSNLADAWTFTDEQHLSSPRRRFQTGQTPEKLARILRLHRPCLETLQRKWHTC